jgi:hypothetical protein
VASSRECLLFAAGSSQAGLLLQKSVSAASVMLLASQRVRDIEIFDIHFSAKHMNKYDLSE